MQESTSEIMTIKHDLLSDLSTSKIEDVIVLMFMRCVFQAVSQKGIQGRD